MIIGSHAAKYHGMNRRNPKDLDKFVFVAPDKSLGDESYIPIELYNKIPQENGYITRDALYTLKCSHLPWDIHWQKTKLDILFFKAHGCLLIEPLYSELKEYWTKVHGDKSYLSLNKSKVEFFTPLVEYHYDHDYLHELCAKPLAPAYTKCLKGEVLIDNELFLEMPFDEQIRMFKEEISVIAVERFMLPIKSRGKFSWYKSYQESLKKTITRLTKNWAEDFIIHNLEFFVKPDFKYFKNLLQLEEIKMSDVDISIFENIASKHEEEVGTLIFLMCMGEYDDYDDGTVNYEFIKREGGGEGGSEDCYGVFKLNDQIYRAEFSYYSYDGFNYYGIENTLRKVKPKVIEVTVYE